MTNSCLKEMSDAHANIFALLLLCCLESVQIHTTSDLDARTTARNWRLSQLEALILCSRESHATGTHDPFMEVTPRPKN